MWSFRIFLFLLALNITAYVVLTATTGGVYLFPFVQYSHGLNSTGNVTNYETAFNGTQAVEQWDPQGGYGFAGDLFSGLNMFWTTFRFLIDGLGMTLDWVGSFIPAAQTSFTYIAWMIRVMFGVVTVVMVYQFITGRNVESAEG